VLAVADMQFRIGDERGLSQVRRSGRIQELADGFGGAGLLQLSETLERQLLDLRVRIAQGGECA
jgi:hypothetical protein